MINFVCNIFMFLVHLFFWPMELGNSATNKLKEQEIWLINKINDLKNKTNTNNEKIYINISTTTNSNINSQIKQYNKQLKNVRERKKITKKISLLGNVLWFFIVLMLGCLPTLEEDSNKRNDVVKEEVVIDKNYQNNSLQIDEIDNAYKR